MAGLLGEGGQVSLSGSWNSQTPATLFDARTNAGNINTGPDGRRCNIYSATIIDATNTYELAIRVSGLQENTTTSKMICLPGVPQTFQCLEHVNSIELIQGWLTDNTGADLSGGNATNSASIIGGVIGRRE